MTLTEYVDVLRGLKDEDEPFQQGEYVSDTTGKVGYWASYNVDDVWYWYSVSDTTEIVLPSTVVNAIINGECQRAGPFKGNGFEATIRFDGQSYMLNMGSTKPRFRK
jgi:hypothetical protein